MKKMIKIFIYVLLSIVLFIFVVRIGSYLMIINSEAYPSAKKIVMSNPEFKDRIGEVEYLDNYSSGGLGWRNGKKTAEITLDVNGENAKGEVTVLMERWGNQKWELTNLFFEEDEE